MNTTDPTSTQFEPGSPAPEGTIPLCVPEIRGNEWKYIKERLDTNWVSSVGPFVDRFERMVVDYVGTKYAVATVNGTAALHTALLVADIQPDDEKCWSPRLPLFLRSTQYATLAPGLSL